MKRLLKIVMLSVLILTLVISLPSYGAMKKLAQVGFKGLIMPVGAREAGMGNAVVSTPMGANSVFWNPAAITEISGDRSIAFNYMNWIADIKHKAGAAVFSLENIGHIGFSVMMLDYGNIMSTRLADNEEGFIETGEFSPGEIAIGLVYARKMTDKFSFGGHLKYARQDLGAGLEGQSTDEAYSVPFNKAAVVFDFGTLYYTGIRDLRIAMSFQNFSKELKYQAEEFPLPLMFRVGIAMDILSLVQEESPNSLTLAVDFQHPRDFSERIHLGAEYMYSDPMIRDIGISSIGIRGGYKFGYDEESWTMGFGLTGLGMKIDYAIQEFGLFGNVNSLSMGFEF